jgi:hypothetical protein
MKSTDLDALHLSIDRTSGGLQCLSALLEGLTVSNSRLNFGQGEFHNLHTLITLIEDQSLASQKHMKVVFDKFEDSRKVDLSNIKTKPEKFEAFFREFGETVSPANQTHQTCLPDNIADRGEFLLEVDMDNYTLTNDGLRRIQGALAAIGLLLNNSTGTQIPTCNIAALFKTIEEDVDFTCDHFGNMIANNKLPRAANKAS